MAKRPLQPEELQPGALPPGFVPFETPAPPGIAHQSGQSTKHTQRHHGTALLPRHHGAPRFPHSHTLATHHHVVHPHHVAAARHRQPAGRHTVPHHHTARLHTSHTKLPARLGVQLFELGVITAYNGVTGLASVRLYGSQSNVIGPLPLGLGLGGVPGLVGTACLVALLDSTNPNDGIIVALYNGAFAPYAQSGRANLSPGAPQQNFTVTFPVAFPNSLIAVTATSDDANWVASVSGQSTTGFTLTLTRRDGGNLYQAGSVNVTINSGSNTGSAAVTFPTAFGVIRAVATSAGAAGFWSGAVSLATTGCTATLSSPTVLGSTQSATVSWIAEGDAVVSGTVNVDWTAVGK